MNIFVYADESGVFDRKHSDVFVFAGLIFLSHEEKDVAIRKYISVERNVKKIEGLLDIDEAKATRISNKAKDKLFRSINTIHKFGVCVRQRHLLSNIFDSKKSKQRFLDYAFKIGVKRKLEELIARGLVNPEEVKSMHFYVDEHSTATDGKYELREALEQEFRAGTFNRTWDKFFPPLFVNLAKVDLQYCNSEKVALIRASDIVANKLYYCVTNSRFEAITSRRNFKVTWLP